MGSANRWNRRQWISAAATTMGAAAALPIRGWPSFGGMFGNAAPGPAHEAVDTKLKGFPLSQVRLRPGISRPETIDLAPLYQNYDERYTVYWKVNKKGA